MGGMGCSGMEEVWGMKSRGRLKLKGNEEMGFGDEGGDD